MAQTGFTPISNYYSATATNVPTAGNLVAGELAINTADGKLFYKDSSGVVQTMASKATGTVAGATTQIIYNNAGAYAGSANFTFDGTNVTFGSSSGAAIRWQNGYQTITGDAGTDVLTYRSYTSHVWKTLTGAGSNTDGTERMRVNGNGIGIGAAVPSSGVGITFPASQSASSDANTLDDYEEGTFTPTWLGSTTNPTVSGMQTCTYTKVGRLVTITGDMYATSVVGGLGNLSIGNLPFTAASGATSYSGVAFGLTTGWNSTGAPTRGYVGSASNQVQLYTNTSSDSRSNTGTVCTVTNTSLASYSEIYLSFSYITST